MAYVDRIIHSTIQPFNQFRPIDYSTKTDHLTNTNDPNLSHLSRLVAPADGTGVAPADGTGARQ